VAARSRCGDRPRAHAVLRVVGVGGAGVMGEPDGGAQVEGVDFIAGTPTCNRSRARASAHAHIGSEHAWPRLRLEPDLGARPRSRLRRVKAMLKGATWCSSRRRRGGPARGGPCVRASPARWARSPWASSPSVGFEALAVAIRPSRHRRARGGGRHADRGAEPAPAHGARPRTSMVEASACRRRAASGCRASLT